MLEKLTASEKQSRRAAAAARYLKQIGRQAQKGMEPNDRQYDRKLDQKLSRMSPVEFDALVNGEE